MTKFKEGDVVYHKATRKRGVISDQGSNGEGYWEIAWEDGKKDDHKEVELYTEEEYKKKKSEKGPSIAGAEF